ncbi:MAG: ABC transporter substrate-binding protein, partial [Pseudolabrys sp.]
MKRRDFITLLGGAAAAWPLTARAQPEQMRRIGVLLSQAESDPVAQSYITTFAARLRELGRIDGKNLLI